MKALEEDLAGYTGRIESKPVQLEHETQRKRLYKKQAGTIIAEGLTGHDEDSARCYFQKCCRSHCESVLHK